MFNRSSVLLCLVTALISQGALGSVLSLRSGVERQVETLLRQSYGSSLDSVDLTVRVARVPDDVDCDVSSLRKLSTNLLGSSSWVADCTSDLERYTVKVRTVVSANLNLPVLIDRVPRGVQLQALDWRYQIKSVTRQADYLTEPLACMETQRAVPAYQPVRLSLVKPCSDMVEGEIVKIRAKASGVQVEAEGELMGDARWGGRVKVRNVSSGQVITGILKRGGVVSL
ncbi:flagellar basal body P-ring formation protein FlgA [Vibrio parahaemolyticus]|nr:flagellar basal body P-ring formation protein FlgA [Vibrio parahaemolyticus]